MPIDLANPLNRTHPLSRGLEFFYVTVPGLAGGRYWHNLVRPGSLAFSGQLSDIMTPSTGILGWQPLAPPGGAGSLGFDDGNVYAVDPRRWRLTTDGFSLATWVYMRSSTGSFQTLAAKYNGGAGNRTYAFTISGAEGNVLRGESSPDGVFYAGNTVLGTTAVASGRWVYAGFTYAPDGTNRIFYNGRQEGSTARSNTGLQASVELDRIGVNAGSTNRLRGRLDGLAAYTRALSSDEHGALYREAAAGYPTLLRHLTRYGVAAASGAASRFFFLG